MRKDWFHSSISATSIPQFHSNTRNFQSSKEKP
jgi:hypothetical protein